jgi:hypothetical protein
MERNHVPPTIESSPSSPMVKRYNSLSIDLSVLTPFQNRLNPESFEFITNLLQGAVNFDNSSGMNKPNDECQKG